MSDAIKFLEELQKNAFENIRETPDELNQKFGETKQSLFDDLMKKYNITDQNEIEEFQNIINESTEKKSKIILPTKYELLHNYSLILDFAELIEDVIPRLGFFNKENNLNLTLKDLDMNITKPQFGTLPIGSLNATSYGFSNNERLIVFESELMQFCNLIAKIIAKSIPFDGSNDKINFQFDEQLIFKQIDQNPEIFQHFEELILGFIITGRATSATAYILESPFNQIADHLRLSMEVFVMGHEYAHILLRHLDSVDTIKKNINSDSVFNIIYSWSQEYDADRLGLPLMICALMNQNRPYLDLSYGGADLFFSSYDVIARAKSIILNGTDEYYWCGGKPDGKLGSHPPAHKRRENLRETMEYQFGVESLIKSHLIEKIMYVLWDKLRPKLIKNRQQLYIDFLTKKVESSFSRKHYSDALDYLEQILQVNENYIPALFGKGNTFQDLNRIPEAVKCYDKILNIENNNVGALLQKSNCYWTQKEYDKSLKMANTALNIEPKNIYVLFAKGKTLEYLEKFDDAMGCYDDILTQDEKNIPALFRKALVLQQIDEDYDAITYFDKILEINPNLEHVNDFKILSYLTLEQYENALAEIEKLLLKNPDDVELLEMKKELLKEKKTHN